MGEFQEWYEDENREQYHCSTKNTLIFTKWLTAQIYAQEQIEDVHKFMIWERRKMMSERLKKTYNLNSSNKYKKKAERILQKDLKEFKERLDSFKRLTDKLVKAFQNEDDENVQKAEQRLSDGINLFMDDFITLKEPS